MERRLCESVVMGSCITHFALTVRDYDEALEFFVGTLGFTLLEDTDLGGGKRWVRVSPSVDGVGASVLLARAATDAQRASVGCQTGGRVFVFLETDDCRAEYARLLARGVVFERPPREDSFGVAAVFRDVYGNLWDLVERRRP